jgi:hypothetical protein
MSLTTLSCAPHGEDSSVVAQVALLVKELARTAGTGCLVEGPDGRLLTHHLQRHDVSSTVVQALVTGEVRPLHESLCRRRATGCLPSGPVVEGLLGEDGPAVAHLVLREGIGTVWLLLEEGNALRLEHVADAAERLRVVLAATWEGMEGSSLRAWLDGVPGVDLPEPLRSASRLWLVGTPDASAVARSLPHHLAARASGPYLLVGGSAATRSAQVAAAVERVLPGGYGAVSVELTDTLDVSVAREALDVARDVAPDGRCVSLGDVRGSVVVRRMGEALDGLPDLGADPLALLEAYDVRRGSNLVGTLRAWLDGFGDAPTVAQSLGVHANTLRYRLGRIQEITGVDLRHDPIGRLELHARLIVHVAKSPR